MRNDDGATFDLRSLTDDIDGAFLGSDGIERVARAVHLGSLAPMDVTGQRIGAPIARPTAVVCIGMNYAAHAAESGAKPPQYPVVFFKHPSCVVGPDDEVIMPPGSTKTDWEVELAVVIKRTPRYLRRPDEAREYIPGSPSPNT